MWCCSVCRDGRTRTAADRMCVVARYYDISSKADLGDIFPWSSSMIKIVTLHTPGSVSVSARIHVRTTMLAYWSKSWRSDVECPSLVSLFILVVFFAQKKYICCFIQLWLNPWCHMDSLYDVLSTFLGLEHGSCVACLCRVIKNILIHFLICIQKMNKYLRGLERHEGVSLMSDLSILD